MHARQKRQERSQSQHCEIRRLHGSSAQLPQGRYDDGDDDRCDPGKDAGDLRKRAVPHVAPRDHADDERRWKDEAHAADEQSRPAVPRQADVDGQLSRVRAWNEVRRANVVQELFARQPSTAAHDFVLHQRDVRSRPAEGRRSEAQKEQGHVEQRRCRRPSDHGIRYD